MTFTLFRDGTDRTTPEAGAVFVTLILSITSITFQLLFLLLNSCKCFANLRHNMVKCLLVYYFEDLIFDVSAVLFLLKRYFLLVLLRMFLSLQLCVATLNFCGFLTTPFLTFLLYASTVFGPVGWYAAPK